MSLAVRPITLRQAQQFIAVHHRHNKPPIGHKCSIGVHEDGPLVGVATAGRPSARALDDGLTIEITRTCTDGARNANSKLYGAVWRAARAMGYVRGITYTQDDEAGSSLKAAGWLRVEFLPARKSWAESSVKFKTLRDPAQTSLLEEPLGNGGVDRWHWEIACDGHWSDAAKKVLAAVEGAVP
jgi:hypothetical protein